MRFIGLCVPLLLLAAACAPSMQPPKPAPDPAVQVQDAIDRLREMPLVVRAEGATATLDAYNTPLRHLDRPEVGFSGSYEISRVPGVAVRVLSPLSPRINSSVVTALGTDMTDVEFLRVVRAARDGAGFEEIAGVLPLRSVLPALTSISAAGRSHSVSDCVVVGEAIDDVLAAKIGKVEGSLVVIYLDPETFHATYLGVLSELSR